VEGDLGIVGAGLHAEVAAAFALVQLVGRQGRDLAQGGWSHAPEAQPSPREEAGAEAEGHGEAGGQ
jgi:hypothetical protein